VTSPCRSARTVPYATPLNDLEHFRALARWLYIHDFDGHFLNANPAALKLLGYEHEDIVALTCFSLLSADQEV
jgi:PAS domain S-box-containing protein